MQFDPENRIVKLCAAGMEAEMNADPQRAQSLFSSAWESASNDLEKFIAAHYAARHQPDAGESLRWNVLALHHAELAADANLSAYLPSLFLNVGKSFEDLDDAGRALEFYRKADTASAALGNDPYGDMIRFGIRNALKRMEQ
jgi:hypothetical protein